MVYVRTGLPRSIPRVFGLVLAAVSLARGGLPAYGQVPQNFQDLLSAANGGSAETSAEQPEQPIPEQLDTLRTKLEVTLAHYENAEGAAEAGAAQQFGVDAKEVEERNGLLRSLYQAYQRDISVLERLQETRESRADLDAQIDAWQGFQEPPPYSIDFVDELRDEIYAEDVAIQAARDQLTMLDDYLDRLRDRVATTDREYKEAVSALERAVDSSGLREIQWRADKTRIARLAAQAALDAFTDDARGLREVLDYHQTAQTFAQKNSPWRWKTPHFFPRSSRRSSRPFSKP